MAGKRISTLTLLLGVGLIGGMQGQGTETPTRHGSRQPIQVASSKYEFSVALPPGWFVLRGGALPILANYPPEKALPQWHLPHGGAIIELVLCPTGGPYPKEPTVESCMEHQFAIEGAGITLQEKAPGPPSLGPAEATLSAGEQVPLGTPRQILHLWTVLWRYQGRVIGAQLSYVKGEPDRHYKAVLLELVRSFQPIR